MPSLVVKVVVLRHLLRIDNGFVIVKVRVRIWTYTHTYMQTIP